jgi:hypothetical protein
MLWWLSLHTAEEGTDGNNYFDNHYGDSYFVACQIE